MKPRSAQTLALRGAATLAVILVAGLVALSFARRAAPTLPAVSLNSDRLEEGFRLADWLVFASFLPPRGKGAPNPASSPRLDHDFLRAADLTETSLTEQNVADLAESAHPGLFNFRRRVSTAPDFRAGVVHSDGQFVDLDGFVKERASAAAYCACVVNSAINQTVWLFASANDGMKCWANNTPLTTIPESAGKDKKEGIAYYERLVPIHLRAGRNLLVFKTTRKTEEWGFVARLASPRRAHALAARYSLAPLLETRLLKVGDPLKIDYPFCDPSCPVSLDVRNARGTSVLSERFSLASRRTVSLGGIPQGVYSASLKTPYGSTTESFCLGDLDATIAGIRERLAALPLSDVIRMHTAAWLYRVDHIRKPEFKHPGDLDWQDRMLSPLSSLAAVLADPHGGNAVLRSPGYHIRAFRSSLDGKPQYYVLVAPCHLRKGRRMPLVLVVPPTFLPGLPFLESRLVAVMSEVHTLCELADESGGLIVMSGAGGNTASDDTRDTDLLDVIADVGRYYAIDADRIYGYGTCTAGTDLMLLAAHHPDLFAAIAVLGAAVDTSDPVSDMPSPSDPLPLLDNLLHVPLLVMHAAGDSTVPVANSVRLAQICSDRGLDVTLKVINGGTHNTPTEDTHELCWAFMTGKKRDSRPRHVHISAASLRYGEAFWAKITGIGDPRRLATLSAVADGPSHLSVDTQNVTSYELLRDRMPCAPAARLTVLTDGRSCPERQRGERLTVQIHPPPVPSSRPAADSTHNRPGAG